MKLTNKSTLKVGDRFLVWSYDGDRYVSICRMVKYRKYNEDFLFMGKGLLDPKEHYTNQPLKGLAGGWHYIYLLTDEEYLLFITLTL